MDFRYGRSFSGGSGNGNDPGHKRYSRSRSRSRERYRRRHSRSRSRDRSSHYRRHHDRSPDRDLYRDLVNEDYLEDQRHYGSRKNFNHRELRNDGHDRRARDHYDRQKRNGNYDRRDRDRSDRWEHDCFDPREQDELDRNDRWMNQHRGSRRRSYDDYEEELELDCRNSDNGNNDEMAINRIRDRTRERSRERRYSSDDDSSEPDEIREEHEENHNTTEASNHTILFGLRKHVTEADIMDELIKVNMEPASIRVMRKKASGASRCFAFVEFKTVEEAQQWMDLTQGYLRLGDHTVSIQYSQTRSTDWTCIKCGVSNFKRRIHCFMCSSSRAESETAVPCDGEGIDEISDILTKKIMLRNLDALTNEEGVLTALQEYLSSDQAKTVSKVQISRDTLTQTSRGICYLNFDTLIDSMNLYNALTALESPLSLDGRTVLVSYCKDPEKRKIFSSPDSSLTRPIAGITAMTASALNGNYTLADVPRLAAYSASVYASNPAEHAYYVQYYTDYYTKEISKQSVNLHVTEANSGAAVALSAIQRQQKKQASQVPLSMTAMAVEGGEASLTARALNTPKGNDGKKYPTPDVSQYQYDETSGFYYDHTTGLYYDAHSQYYYNNETGAYLYWDQKRSTYVLATPASTQAALQEVLADAEQKEEEARKAKEKEKDKEGGSNKHDKVKVAKKIVKDMEKWAKQLNQKKDYTAVATPQPILQENDGPSTSRASQGGYADLGFSILEKKEREAKTTDLVPQLGLPVLTKLANTVGGTSEDSEDESAGPSLGVGTTATAAPQRAAPDEADFVDFQKLTCQLCKRAFQSLDILQKHLKISTLHKENLAKLNQNSVEPGIEMGLSYRDRAKERRLKYGEDDPPPNRSRELFEQDMKTLQTSQKNNVGHVPAMPIGSSNVGNRLMQKMGWSEGQGLGRSNQGRTQLIEADGHTNNVGLGNKARGQMFPGSDYKTYIKKMMKQRYDNA
ncbi:hypothetical protein KR038_005717 [Drosophila bunnanda]|nr:hypothetical protein KR038_005717 [Drosophila bunnanda]